MRFQVHFIGIGRDWLEACAIKALIALSSRLLSRLKVKVLYPEDFNLWSGWKISDMKFIVIVWKGLGRREDWEDEGNMRKCGWNMDREDLEGDMQKF